MHLRPIFWMLPSAFSSIVVSPPAMLPFVGCESDRSDVLWRLIDLLVAVEHAHEVGAHVDRRGSAPRRSARRRSARSSRRTPACIRPRRACRTRRRPSGSRRSRTSCPIRRTSSTPTAPASAHSSRTFSLAHCTYSFATFDARMIVSWSPCSSMPKPVTGLPVAAMPSTTRLVHWSSMPMTTTAATFGFAPVPISVRKWCARSRRTPARPPRRRRARPAGASRQGRDRGRRARRARSRPWWCGRA